MTRDAPDQFVTAVAALIDADSGELRLCSAGHVPLVVVRPDGSTEVVGGGSGVPLGVLPGAHRETLRCPLERGSLVVVCTDGVVESRRGDLDEGIERLRRRAVELRDRPLDEVADGLGALADASLHDDVTVLVARLR